MTINGVDSNSVNFATTERNGQAYQNLKKTDMDFAKGNYRGVTRGQLADTGKTEIFDHAHRTIDTVDTTSKNQKLVELRLTEQETYIKQLDKIFLDFETLINKPCRDEGAFGSDEQIANEALQKIENILNKQVDGRYVFGGQDTSTKPVPDSLINNSNFRGGKILQNYTKSVASDASVVIDAEQQTLKPGHLYAGSAVITKMIGALNMFKAQGDGDDYQRVKAEVHTDIGAIEYVLSLDKKALEESSAINSSYDSISRDIIESFYGTMLEGQQRLQDVTNSYKAHSTITTEVDKVVNESSFRAINSIP